MTQATRLCSVLECGHAVHARGLCGTHYMRLCRSGLPPVAQPTTEERFLAKVDKNGPGGCWLWTGAHGQRGRYGSFGDGRRANGNPFIVLAHRWAYLRWVGPLAEGECVLHRCDNDKCVNPDHLFKGTRQDNVADMMAKGRHRPSTRATNGNAKLTTAQVAEIRQRYAAGGVTQKNLGDEYGVTQSAVSRILRASGVG